MKDGIENWLQADLALRRVGLGDIEIARLQADLGEAVARIKTDYDVKIGALLAVRKEAVKALGAFVKAHRKDFDGKSHRLTHGVVGFRKGKGSIAFQWKVETILEALRVRYLTACIRVEETPNKDALGLLDDAQLESVGCRRVEGRDQFFLDPDLERITERPA